MFICLLTKFHVFHFPKLRIIHLFIFPFSDKQNVIDIRMNVILFAKVLSGKHNLLAGFSYYIGMTVSSIYFYCYN